MRDVVLMPESARPALCPACEWPVWSVVDAKDRPLLLDHAADPEGTVEMVRVGGVWRAEVLFQTECLFEVDRPRWRPHGSVCPARAAGIPQQRRRRR